MKNVLILCTGNSCRSIMGEALINHHLGSKGVKAYSSGVAPSGIVNPNALQALSECGISIEGLSSKTLDKLPLSYFDLVVTVCDHANETCPMFAGKAVKLHCGFEDPSGGEYEGYVKTLKEIEQVLVPLVVEKLQLN
jgi:arsenate reductase (thioredoxin)